jgi:hypothetical protein
MSIPKRENPVTEDFDSFVKGAAAPVVKKPVKKSAAKPSAKKSDARPADKPLTRPPQPDVVYVKARKFLLELDESLRRELRVEAIMLGYPCVSKYLVEILERRKELGYGG